MTCTGVTTISSLLAGSLTRVRSRGPNTSSASATWPNPSTLADGMTTGRGSCLAASVGRDARAHDGAVAAPRTTDLAVRAAAPGTVGDVRDSDDAARLAEKMLAAELPRRWRHVRSVARRARWTAKQLSLSEDLVAAAWLHDIGYAQELVETGFHPLDGARYLRRIGIDAQVVSLVAYHSCAEIETEVRGLDE